MDTLKGKSQIKRGKSYFQFSKYLLPERSNSYYWPGVPGMYVVSESGPNRAFEVTSTLEATTLLPGGFIIVPSYPPRFPFPGDKG